MDGQSLEPFLIPSLGLGFPFDGFKHGFNTFLVPRRVFTEVGSTPIPGLVSISGVVVMPGGRLGIFGRGGVPSLMVL
jgi:hypothetical protein